MQKLKDGMLGVATVCLSIAILGLVAVTYPILLFLERNNA